MEVLLNKLFDKHSEGFGVYDRENLIKDICKELQALYKHDTSELSKQLNYDHEWKADKFDCYGFPTEEYCDKCCKIKVV